MKKAKVIIFFLLIYFILYFLQTNFFSWFNINGVQPNLFVVLALFVGLNTNSKVGQIMGFVIGFLTDCLYSDTIGISAVLFTFIGFSGEILQKRFPKNSKITIIIMSTITTAIYEILRVAYRAIFYSSYVSILAFIGMLAIELVFNALLIITMYPTINRLGMMSDDVFNGNDMETKYF